ncbi:hypothetical protein HA402_013330 [Bradysia odoriphaga]|nr:hypothetical protein HA402_013330 [Bradysia odoriphaga]
MSTPKWIPKLNDEVVKLFEQTRNLERDFRVLGKKFTTDINMDLPDFYEFGQLVSQSKKCFEVSEQLQRQLMKLAAMSSNKKVERSPYKVLQSKKATMCRHNLKRRHFQLIFVINRMIKLMLGNSFESDIVIDGALLLCSLHNGSVEMTKQNLKAVSGAQVCSNSFPILLLSPKKIDVGMILQIISKQRSENCCLTLIQCLLATCRPELNANTESDTSSVEILKALTFHLASPSQKPQSADAQRITSQNETQNDRSKSVPPPSDKNKLSSEIAAPAVLSDSECNDPAIKFFDKMASELNNQGNVESLFQNDDDTDELLEQLIANEENYIANILLKCLKFCPSSFDKQPSKAEVIKWVNRGTSKLWAQVGSTLEHIVLWWSDAPLACRPVACARYLRDWLLIIQPEDAPEPILSTLRGLGETLTVYVTGTTWDKQFRLTLVSSVLPVNYNFENTEFHCANDRVRNLDGTTTGRLWSELLFSLTTFCNSCDQKGTIPNELPIVEQIPILHRLDHSVHTMRLWAAYKAKELCTEWNMKMFFKVVYNDVNHCLEQLKELRVPELVPADSFEVLVQVCVALRAKLVSEIKVNVNKLKQTYGECIDVLASICQTISLATLTLCFPSPKLWQSDSLQENANEYVAYYLNQLYLPVLQATHILDILSLILKLLCEAWLDHIYMRKIKFR